LVALALQLRELNQDVRLCAPPELGTGAMSGCRARLRAAASESVVGIASAVRTDGAKAASQRLAADSQRSF
jgi:hypothetical protein